MSSGAVWNTNCLGEKENNSFTCGHDLWLSVNPKMESYKRRQKHPENMCYLDGKKVQGGRVTGGVEQKLTSGQVTVGRPSSEASM